MGALQGLRQALDKPTPNKFLLLACAVIWGISFSSMKDVVAQIPTFWLLAIRFTMAAVLCAVVFHRQLARHLDRTTIRVGLTLGALEWAAYVLQTWGLTMTTPGKNAFLTGTYCVLVPFCAMALGMGKPRRYDLVAAFICLGGLALVALDNGFPLNAGDLLTLLGAVFFAFQLVEVNREGQRLDVFAITTWQFIFMAVASWVCTPFEVAPTAAVFTPGNILQLLFLGVVCSFVALTVMNFSMARVDPAEGALLCSVESPSGVAYSVLAGHELLTGRLALGFTLIFLAILISNGWPALRERIGWGTQET